jgi:hypothetical protein
VVDTEEIVEVAYTGDTKLEAVLDVDLVARARLLVVECTYLEGEVVWAHKWHHVHIKVRRGWDVAWRDGWAGGSSVRSFPFLNSPLAPINSHTPHPQTPQPPQPQELVQHAARFAQNERIVLCHVSRKYKLHANVLSLIRQALASVPSLAARVGVTLAGFGRPAHEPVTWLALADDDGGGGGGNDSGGGAKEGGAVRSQQQQMQMQALVLGADGGLEGEMPEVKTKEEVGRMLRVMSEDIGLRPRAESLVGEIEIVDNGGGAAGDAGGGGGKGKQPQPQQQEEEEPTLQF